MENKNEVKYTPGPWHLGMQPGPIVYGPNGEQVADMRRGMLHRHEDVANIRLIAAAPELLAGAKELEHYASRLPFESATVGLMDSLVRIRAAIAKAEGR